MSTLEEMQERHRAVARYRIVLSEMVPVKKRTVVASGLHWTRLQELKKELDADLARQAPSMIGRFMGPLHLIELENPDDCLSPEAKARMALIRGGGAASQSGRTCFGSAGAVPD